MVARLCSCLASPDRVVNRRWLDGRGSKFDTLGFRSTGQEGLLSSLIFLWKKRKDKRMTPMQMDEHIYIIDVSTSNYFHLEVREVRGEWPDCFELIRRLR